MSTGEVHLQCRLSYSADPQNEPISMISYGRVFCFSFSCATSLCHAVTRCDGWAWWWGDNISALLWFLVSLRVFKCEVAFVCFYP